MSLTTLANIGLKAWPYALRYLRRRDRQPLMTVEHRAAPGLDDIEIELKEGGEEPSFRLRRPPPGGPAPQPETPERSDLKALADARAPNDDTEQEPRLLQQQVGIEPVGTPTGFSERAFALVVERTRPDIPPRPFRQALPLRTSPTGWKAIR